MILNNTNEIKPKCFVKGVTQHFDKVNHNPCRRGRVAKFLSIKNWSGQVGTCTFATLLHNNA